MVPVCLRICNPGFDSGVNVTFNDPSPPVTRNAIVAESPANKFADSNTGWKISLSEDESETQFSEGEDHSDTEQPKKHDKCVLHRHIIKCAPMKSERMEVT